MKWVLLPVAFALGLGIAALAVRARVVHKTVTLPARTTTLPARTVTRTRVRTRVRTRTVILNPPVRPPSSSGIPQGNGGDHDSDNNGGPSDGDGNI